MVDQEHELVTAQESAASASGTELAPPPSRISVSALQARLRGLFAEMQPTQAVAASLAEIGDYLDGVYMVFHACMGTRLYSEEWNWEGFNVIDSLRDTVSGAMADVMSTERAKCSRMGQGIEFAPAMVTAPVFDASQEVVGATCVVVGPCDREKAYEILSLFEGIVGYLSLLATDENLQRANADATEDLGIVIPREAEQAVGDPLFLAYAMAARLKNRFYLDQVIVGFVRGARVRIAAVCGLDEVRQSNPGVKLVRAAMEECLDRREPVAFQGFLISEDGKTLETDCRLHVQWSRGVGGDAVGSFPLIQDGRVIAVISVRVEATSGLSEESMANYAREMEPYSCLVPISKLASRGLMAHLGGKVAAGLMRVFGVETWRSRALLVAAGLLVLWTVFGSLTYSFTVPCSVVPANPRTVASPREGVLEAVHVRPGDLVRKGELLARIAVDDERLQEASLASEIRRLAALIDKARADGRPDEAKVYGAQQESSQAQLDLVRLRIRRSEIRAPEDGIVLVGDLRRAIGSKLGIGETLFEMAQSTRVQVEVQIPEHQVWEARECEVATFAPSARPTEQFILDALTVHPSSTAVHGKNVFLARSTSFDAPAHLTPGMEGVVHVEVGERAVWWILTHRISDWLRLRFWL